MDMWLNISYSLVSKWLDFVICTWSNAPPFKPVKINIFFTDLQLSFSLSYFSIYLRKGLNFLDKVLRFLSLKMKLTFRHY